MQKGSGIHETIFYHLGLPTGTVLLKLAVASYYLPVIHSLLQEKNNNTKRRTNGFHVARVAINLQHNGWVASASNVTV